MKHIVFSFVIAVVLSNAYLPCAHAQGAQPGGPPPSPPAANGNDAWIDRLDRLNREANDINKANDKSQAMKVGPSFIKDSQLSCELTDARHASDGRAYINGKTVNVNSYEVACSNGTGYILASLNKQPPTVMSCFGAASANEEAAPDKQHSRGSIGVSCLLPDNLDTKAMASNLLKGLNITCTASGVSVFGVNASNRTEYVEVACGNDIGYVLSIPQQIDATTQISAMSCEEAARHKLQCRLTTSSAAASTSAPASASAPVTAQALYDALNKNGVNCTSTKLQLRMIGRETTKKRYVVETQCPDQPGGLVAYIPLGDNTNAFETIDCSKALERQITCQLNAK